MKGFVQLDRERLAMNLPHTTTRLKALLCTLFILAPIPEAAFADHLMITRYFSGAWAQRDHESQGLVLQIAEQAEDIKVGVAHWFTFGEEKGQIEVIESDGIFRGRLKFTDPHEPATLPLNFDPRGEVVEILDGDSVILESLFPDE